jgi:nucleoid-associated protein YgaU
MSLKEKYQDVLALGNTLGVQLSEVKEDKGKLHLKGSSTYELEKDLLWDKIKAHSGWESEVAVNIQVQKTDIHGIHTVQSGDTLSKIAKVHLDNSSRYMEIFNANKNILKDPNLIKVGQKLVIPKK